MGQKVNPHGIRVGVINLSAFFDGGQQRQYVLILGGFRSVRRFLVSFDLAYDGQGVYGSVPGGYGRGTHVDQLLLAMGHLSPTILVAVIWLGWFSHGKSPLLR